MMSDFDVFDEVEREARTGKYNRKNQIAKTTPEQMQSERIERGRDLAEVYHSVQQIQNAKTSSSGCDVYLVTSQYEPGRYYHVKISPEGQMTCDCGDSTHRALFASIR